MTNQPSGKSLSTVLKTHADSLRPAFSPLLHERIMRKIRQEARRSGAAAPLPAARFRPVWRWPAAGAAMVALAGALWAFSIFQSSPTAPQQIAGPSSPVPAPAAAQASPTLPSLEPVQMLLQTAVDPTRAKLEDGKFAYLDHDARRFAGFVLSQLPGPRQ